MPKNLGMSNGRIVGEAVMMGLAPFIGRQEAHDVVYAACRVVAEQGGTLADALLGNIAVTTHLDESQIHRLTDPANYLSQAPEMVDRVVGALPRDGGPRHEGHPPIG